MTAAPDTDRPTAPTILHRDARIVVVDKPAGLAVHKGWAVAPHYVLDLVRDAIGQHLFPVHRLDQPTSGVLVFALDKEAARHLSDQLCAQAVFKRYVAIVRGPARFDRKRVDHPLADLSRKGDPDPQRAVTEFQHLLTSGRYSFVSSVPETGRSHQIRRHLKHLSLHIIGDVKYGKGEHNRFFRDNFGLNRLALHALDLGFLHPDDDRPVFYRAPLPDDLIGPLAAAGFDTTAALAQLTPPKLEVPVRGTMIDYEGRRRLLTEAKTVAVLGAHPEATRPAFYVPDYLSRMGYRVLPVNATRVGEALWGQAITADLAGLAEPVDFVDVFRPSSALEGHLDDLLAMRPLPRAVWLQLGIHDDAFIERVLDAGIDVVDNACALADHRTFALPAKTQSPAPGTP